MSAPEVLVLGGGVMGLTSALRLTDTGFRVRIWSAAPWPETVSAVAAAVWYPFRAYPAERVEGWARQSFGVFETLAADPACGVALRAGRVLWEDAGTDPGLSIVPGEAVPVLRPERLSGYAFGARVTLPVVEMPLYLAWLQRQAAAQGVETEIRAAHSLDEALSAAPLVVNCTGLAARTLAADPAVVPIRGQVVRVENPGIEEFSLDAGEHEEEIMYVIPRSRDVVLGGTAKEGRSDLDPDPASTRAILERCAAVEPALEGARVLGVSVGLRPGRPSVRVEREERSAGLVVHNYGHGGSGVTVSWGCAEEVVQLAGGPGSQGGGA